MAGIDFTTKSTPVSLITNSGGLNSTASPLNVQDNEATEIQNIDFDRFGAFAKRNGFNLLNTVAANGGATCTSLHFFQNKTADELIATFGDEINTIDLTTGALSDISGSTEVFTGTGLDDATFSGALSTTIAPVFKVNIDSIGTVLTVDTIVQPTGALNNGTHTAITTTKTGGDGDDALTVDVTIAGGVITVVVVATPGTGYAVDDTITLTGLSGGGGGGNDDGTVDIATIADTFEWFKNKVSQDTGVTITAGAQLLDSGISVTFAATDGHTLNDFWSFYPPVTITAGNDNLWTWITFNNAMYGVNGVDFPLKVDADLNTSNFPTPTGLTTANYIESFENYVFLFNSLISGITRPTRLNWSTLDDAEEWDAADFNEIGLDDGEDGSGLKKLGDRLGIYKERSIYIALFTGDSDIPFVFKKTPSPVGSDSGYEIQEVQNGHVFHAFDGFYFFDGFNSTKISDRITTTLDTFNKSRFNVMVSAQQKSKNRYWASASTSGTNTNDRIITWDNFNNAFSVYKGINANAMVVLNVDGEEKIFFGDYDGFVYEADVSTADSDRDTLDAKVAIDAFYKTKFFNFGDIVLQKGVAQSVFYYDFEETNLTLAYAYDLADGDTYSQLFSLSSGGTNWDEFNWDEADWAGSGGRFKRVDHTGRGRLIRLIFRNSSIDEPFKINGFGFFIHLETVV